MGSDGTIGVLVVVGDCRVDDGDGVGPDGLGVDSFVGLLLDAGAGVTTRTAVPAFPAASRAVTVITFGPAARTMPDALQPVVPNAVPLPPRSFAQLTCVTPTLSLAVPPMTTLVLGVVNAAAVVGL